MSQRDFIVELGTEELPPNALKGMSEAFADSILSQLDEQQLGYDSHQLFATPRRLAVLVCGLAEQAPDQHLVVEGPPKSVALDADGNFSRAAEAFARKNGVAVTSLQFEATAKGEKLVHRASRAGVRAEAVLAAVVATAINAIPVPKRMRWGALRDEFSRPVQWLLLLFGETVINTELFGLPAARYTRGHRFCADTTITINQPRHYETRLRDDGYVIASFAQRRQLILEQILELASSLNGDAVIPEALLEEVCGLVEYPVALVGQFEEHFLSVPKEALMSSMMAHQKYFPVVDASGALKPCFIFVSNINSNNPAAVIDGNERVIRPRLADAAFFFETDLKQSLADRLPALERVVFQTELGSIGDKARRIAALASTIATELSADAAAAERAGLLCKADLVSELVLEFDDLQGLAGAYYAANDGETDAVAAAIKDHYLPKGPGDALPGSAVAVAVAVADRLDSLVGIFGIGLAPTGSKDPFALRRAALAVIRIIQEKALQPLNLAALLQQARDAYNGRLTNNNVLADTANFISERYRARYQEQGLATDCLLAVQAVTAANANPYDIDLRVKAVAAFKQLAEAEALAAANKRVANILAKTTSTEAAAAVNHELLTDAAERQLAAALDGVKHGVGEKLASREYSAALSQLAGLRPAVDAFFDNVLVMADDAPLRHNRIALLASLRQLFTAIADISELQY